MRFSKKLVVLLLAALQPACASELESVFPSAGYINAPSFVRKDFFLYVEREYPNGRRLSEGQMRRFLSRNRFVCDAGPGTGGEASCRAPVRLEASRAVSWFPPFAIVAYQEASVTIKIRQIAAGWWEFDDVEIRQARLNERTAAYPSANSP